MKLRSELARELARECARERIHAQDYHNKRIGVEEQLVRMGLDPGSPNRLPRPDDLSIDNLNGNPFHYYQEDHMYTSILNVLLLYNFLEYFEYVYACMVNRIWEKCVCNNRSMWSKIVAAFYEGYIENVQPLNVDNMAYKVLIDTMLNLLEGRVAYICYNRIYVMNHTYEHYLVRIDGVVRAVSIKIDDVPELNGIMPIIIFDAPVVDVPVVDVPIVDYNNDEDEFDAPVVDNPEFNNEGYNNAEDDEDEEDEEEDDFDEFNDNEIEDEDDDEIEFNTDEFNDVGF